MKKLILILLVLLFLNSCYSFKYDENAVVATKNLPSNFNGWELQYEFPEILLTNSRKNLSFDNFWLKLDSNNNITLNSNK